MNKTISLKEALCGFSFPLTHLDGRVLLVKSQEGAILKPGAMKSIPGEGMPQHRNPFNKGNLNITFTIEMPDTIDESMQATLLKILPKGPKHEGLASVLHTDGCAWYLLFSYFPRFPSLQSTIPWRPRSAFCMSTLVVPPALRAGVKRLMMRMTKMMAQDHRLSVCTSNNTHAQRKSSPIVCTRKRQCSAHGDPHRLGKFCISKSV